MMQQPKASTSEHHKLLDYINLLDQSKLSYYEGFISENYDTHIFDIFDNFFHNEDNIVELDLTEQEKGMYKHNVKGLCVELFGSHVWWQLILDLNEINHEGDFDISGPVKVPAVTPFFQYLGVVYNIKRVDLAGAFKE